MIESEIKGIYMKSFLDFFQKIAEYGGSVSGWRPQTPKHPIRPNKSGGVPLYPVSGTERNYIS